MCALDANTRGSKVHRVYGVPRLVSGRVSREKLRVTHFTTTDGKWVAVKRESRGAAAAPSTEKKKTGNEKLCTHSCAQLTYPHPALTKYILNLLTQPQVNKVVVRGTKWSFADAPTRLLLPLVDRQKAAGDTWGHILRKDGAVGAAQLSVSWVYKKTGVWKLCWVNPRGLENTTELWPRSLPSEGRPPPTHPSACFFETVHLWKPLRTDLAVSGFTVT